MSILTLDDSGSVPGWLGNLLEHKMAQLWIRVGLHLLQHHPDNGAVLRLPNHEVGFCRPEATLGPCWHLGVISRKSYRNIIARSGWSDIISVDSLTTSDALLNMACYSRTRVFNLLAITTARPGALYPPGRRNKFPGLIKLHCHVQPMSD
jgi:hypothetical protein